MNSRTILISGSFCLACIILLGSMAISLAVGDNLPEDPPVQENRKPASETIEERDEPTPQPRSRQRPKELIKLQTLTRHAEALMATDPAFRVSPNGQPGVPLSDEAVTLFAEMVKIIDESAGLRFVIEVGDPDEFAATERAELLRSSLLLSLKHPSRLRIEEKSTASPQLTVRTTDTTVSP